MIEANTDKGSIDWGSIEKSRILKARSGDYVVYKVDYLLDHLAREICLLECSREKTKRDTKHFKFMEDYDK